MADAAPAADALLSTNDKASGRCGKSCTKVVYDVAEVSVNESSIGENVNK